MLLLPAARRALEGLASTLGGLRAVCRAWRACLVERSVEDSLWRPLLLRRFPNVRLGGRQALPMRALYRLLRQHTFGEAPGSNAHARWTPRASSSLTAAEESTPPPPQPAVLAVEDFTFVLVSQLTSVGTSTRRPQRQLPIWSSKVWLGSLDGTELEREPMQRGANDTADAFFGSCLEAEDERGTTRLTVYVAPPSAPSTPMSLLYAHLPTA